MRSSGTGGRKFESTTLAENQISQNNGSHCTGQLSVVGIGPGSLLDMSPRAKQAIQAADVIVGYNTYISLISELLGGKKVVGTGMMQEIDRCQTAVDLAAGGENVVVVSSGDPGIYGMAGLVLELAMKFPADKRPSVTVVSGISAVGASAAILGAPLMHDFAVISLSDLMTPWEVIKKRVEMVAASDFVISLYNPRSKRRVTQILEVRDILLKYRSPETPVGIVQQATRPGEKKVISNLDQFTQEYIDMFSLVIIGNSQTYVLDDYIITPRGYKI